MQLEEQLLQQDLGFSERTSRVASCKEFELDEQCHQQIMQLQQVRIIQIYVKKAVLRVDFQAAFQQKSQLEHQAELFFRLILSKKWDGRPVHS